MADVELSTLGSVVKTAYEAEADTNAYTDAEKTTVGNQSGTNTGNQTITLTGDVTGSGTGSFATTIADEAVTLAKMAHIATASIMGRNTASDGDVEVLSATTVRSIINVEDGADVTDTANVDAAGAVMETDYNAQTILIAVTDDTPAAVTISASTFVGRKATGDAGTMSTTEARTLLNVANGATADAKASEAEVFTGTDDEKFVTPLQLKPKEANIIALGDETTAATTGTAKVTFRMPYAFELSEVRASATTAPTDAVATFDINEGGVTILSTKLTIDATEKTSTTAAIPAVIDDGTLADDAEITIDIDTVGSTIAGAGYKIYLIGNRT